MRMKYLTGFYTCELGDTSTSQQQHSHDIRMDGHEAFISPASLVLLVWGQSWIQPEGSVSQWQVSFGKQGLLLTPELPALPAEDPERLSGAKLMFLTCQNTQGDCNALQRSSHIHRQLFISSQNHLESDPESNQLLFLSCKAARADASGKRRHGSSFSSLAYLLLTHKFAFRIFLRHLFCLCI